MRLVYYPRQVNKVGNIPSAKIHSSGLLIPLIPHRIKKYTDILTRQEHALKRKYKNRNLSQVFDTLHRKIIAIGPIAVCDYLCLDLGKKCPETILSSIGTISLQISSHDDAVDETPNDQSDLAALIYAGNIASLEAIKNLIENGYKNIAKILIDIVNRNHFLQQKKYPGQSEDIYLPQQIYFRVSIVFLLVPFSKSKYTVTSCSSSVAPNSSSWLCPL